MRKTIVAIAAVAPLSSAVPTLAYGTPGCVTKAEYQRVEIGFEKARVHRIFATRGKQVTIFKSGGHTFEDRVYRVCSSGKWKAFLYFENGRAQGKVAYF